MTDRHGALEGRLGHFGVAVEVLECTSSRTRAVGLRSAGELILRVFLQRTYASDYIGLVLILAAYLAVRPLRSVWVAKPALRRRD